MEYLTALSYLAVVLVVGLETWVLATVAREVASIVRSDAIVRRRQLLEEYLGTSERRADTSATARLTQVPDYVE